jgi:hypothetical protein
MMNRLAFSLLNAVVTGPEATREPVGKPGSVAMMKSKEYVNIIYW